MKKIKAYFDYTGNANLYQLSEMAGQRWLTFDFHNIKEPLAEAGFEIAYRSSIEMEFGMYIVSVRNYCNWWSGSVNPGPSRHVLYEIPLAVLHAARKGNAIIVIDNQSEGMSLNFGGFEGFKKMHEVMHNLQLPPNSVLIINGDFDFKKNYQQWCFDNNEQERLLHVPFLTWTWILNNRVPDRPLILDAIDNPNSKSFNSLNRTPKFHRIEHLYYLIENKLLDEGIVSGHYLDTYSEIKFIPPKPMLVDANYEYFTKLIHDNLPLYADGPWIEANPDDSDEHIFNTSLYKNSLLSVVTESAYADTSKFITEKIFKPIAAGHPFLLIGQPGVLETLRELGYKTDFSMINPIYDNVSNHKTRFKVSHSMLTKWVNTPREEKIEMINKSMDTIEYNQNLFRNRCHVKESYQELYKTIEQFKNSHNASYGN